MTDDLEIDALLIDFGGVFTMSPFDALRSFEDEVDASVDDLLAAVFGDYHRDTDHPWHRLERGEIALTEAQELIALEVASLGVELDLFTVLARMGEGGGIREDVVITVREIRSSGVPVVLVTNNVREFGELWRGAVPVDELFDEVVDSSEVGLRKPDARIYELALDRAGSEPGRTVFLDDFEGNVRAAEALGIQGILVESDHRPAFAELRSRLAPR